MIDIADLKINLSQDKVGVLTFHASVRGTGPNVADPWVFNCKTKT
jgi:hypothetical protein